MTKVLLVNNDSDTWRELVETAHEAGFEVTTIGCRDMNHHSADGFDAVVLSGGWWYDDEIRHLEVYKGELEFLRTTDTPTLGICVGMQLMQLAHSGQIQLLDKPQHDVQTIDVASAGQLLLGWPKQVKVHKNHTMGALVAAPEFEVLASSPGHIEMIKHQVKPLLGVQFHPEVGERKARAAMLRQLVGRRLG